MKEKEAISLFLNYKDQTYIYIAGPAEGKKAKAKSWLIDDSGRLMIVMSDGNKIEEVRFSEVFIPDDSSKNSYDFYNNPEYGETEAKSVLEIERENQKKKFQKKSGISIDGDELVIPEIENDLNQNPNAKKQEVKEVINPIGAILSKSKSTQNISIPIEIDLSIISKQAFDLIKMTFEPEEYRKEIFDFYSKKIDLDFVKEKVIKSLEDFLSREFEENFKTKKEEIVKKDDAIEGILLKNENFEKKVEFEKK